MKTFANFHGEVGAVPLSLAKTKDTPTSEGPMKLTQILPVILCGIATLIYWGTQSPGSASMKPSAGPTAKVTSALPSQNQNEEKPSVSAASPDPMATAISILTQTVLEKTLSHTERRQALFELTQMGSSAFPALSQIASAPLPAVTSTDPHSAETLHNQFEVGLRITAIERLDENTDRPDLVKQAMLEVLNTHKNRSLVTLAQISLSGIEAGHPGKVKRAIDALLKENK